ncbi:MAG: sensor histidine kinase [Bacteroidota bacterium]
MNYFTPRFVCSLLATLLLSSFLNAQSPRIDSLESLLPQHPQDTLLVDIYNDLFNAYLYQDNQKAAKYAQKEFELAKKLGHKRGIANGHVNVGLSLFHQGEDAEALEHMLTALKLQEKRGATSNVSNIYLNMGIINGSSGNYEKAIAYFEKNIALNKELGKPYYNARSNIGRCYLEMKDYDKALEYYEEVNELAENAGNERYLVFNLITLGTVYGTSGQHAKAIAYGKKALALNEKFQSKTNFMHAYLVTGSAYVKLGEYPKAIKELEQAEKYAKEINDKGNLLIAYDYLAESYAGNKDYKLAFEKGEAFSVLSDSLDRVGQEERIASLQANHELEMLKKDQQIKETELRETRVLTGISILVLLLILGLSWLLNRNKLKEQAQKLTISRQEEELSKQKLFALQKEQELKSIASHLKGQTEERKRIAKDLHDSLGSDLASLKLHMQSLSGSDKSGQLYDLIQAVDKSCREVRAISHQLLPPAFGEENFDSILQQMIRGFQLNQECQISLDISDPSILNDIQADKQVEIYRIIQEAIHNALKHASPSHISIMLSMLEKELSVLIEDNGKGFCSESISDGIGLRNMKDRTRHLSGRLSIDSHPERGTVVHVEVPLLTATLSPVS